MTSAGDPVATPPPRVSAPSLLRAKLRAPATPQYYVRRPRLLELLDEVVTAPLTVVVASAGAGKTSLLAGWAAESTLTTAWLSLDEADRDGVALWSGIIAALETLSAGRAERALAPLRRRRGSAEAVGQLLDELEAEDHPPTVLVIDDIHEVDADPVVAASLASFLQHLPVWLHVVLLSRRTPKLPLDRLRARGQLGEVHFAELKFSPDEAREMLARLAPSLSEDDIDAAAESADGWAAGLQLAALTARSARAQQTFEAPISSGTRLVHDYVVHEALADEAPELVEALLDVAVVERVNPSLACALTGRADAGDLLLRAEARGLFVTLYDPEGWFDLHSLVRGVLIAELARRSPARLVELHERAARWFEDAGEVPLALEHWLLATRPRDALRLLAERHGDLYDRGRQATISRTIAAIPLTVANADLQSTLEYAWCHLLVNRRRFLEAVEQATWRAGQSAAAETILRARLVMLQSMAATITGHCVEGGALARQALTALGDGWWCDPLGRFAWNMVAREMALSERWDEGHDDVRGARLVLSRDPERRVALEGTRALGEALAGRPVDALRVAAGVRHVVAEVSNMTILRTELATAEAIAHRELGDGARALAELEALADMPAETMLSWRILAMLELAQARLDESDLDAAGSAFDQAEALIETESFGPDGRGWLARVGTRLALAAGNIDDARHWSEELDDPFWTGVSAARVRLAEGKRADAVAALETVTPRCVRHDVILGLLRGRAVDDHDESMKCATAAVELATANGMLQTVASEGPEALELVERAAWRAPQPWLERLRRAAAAQARSSPSARRDQAEPLTERERDVLRYLPSRLTVREIADELYISLNTLKFHLKVIYRKLGVNSRAEAAAKARQMTVR